MFLCVDICVYVQVIFIGSAIHVVIAQIVIEYVDN